MEQVRDIPCTPAPHLPFEEAAPIASRYIGMFLRADGTSLPIFLYMD